MGPCLRRLELRRLRALGVAAATPQPPAGGTRGPSRRSTGAGRRRSAYGAPRGSGAPGPVSSGAESKRRRCPRPRARQSRVTLLRERGLRAAGGRARRPARRWHGLGVARHHDGEERARRRLPLPLDVQRAVIEHVPEVERGPAEPARGRVDRARADDPGDARIEHAPEEQVVEMRELVVEATFVRLRVRQSHTSPLVSSAARTLETSGTPAPYRERPLPGAAPFMRRWFLAAAA